MSRSSGPLGEACCRTGNRLILAPSTSGSAQYLQLTARHLKVSAPGVANIKALLGHDDWFADLDQEQVAALTEAQRRRPREVRRALAAGRGTTADLPSEQVLLAADNRIPA